MTKDVEKYDNQTKTYLLEEETELRLGLPGNSNSGKNTGGGGEEQKALFRKRGFSDLSISILNAEILEDKKTLLDESGADDADLVKPPSKDQVVGWPPVRSFRKNMMVMQTKISCTEEPDGFGAGAVFVKVSMDGAPYLRKLDLKNYKSYRELSEALRDLFSPFTTIGTKDLTNDSCEYVSTYEDKDGDWMLVGDVPWEMFVASCRRLRMMKGKEAIKTWLVVIYVVFLCLGCICFIVLPLMQLHQEPWQNSRVGRSSEKKPQYVVKQPALLTR